MGAAQLGFSGGEPLVRPDLAELIKAARDMGYYTNLITSGIGLTEQKVRDFKVAGLDHIQISFQAADEAVNNMLAGSRKAFAQKLAMARAVKAQGYPMVLNFVTHRHNIDDIARSLICAWSWKRISSNWPPASSMAGPSSTASACCRPVSNCSAPSASPTNIANVSRPRGIRAS